MRGMIVIGVLAALALSAQGQVPWSDEVYGEHLCAHAKAARAALLGQAGQPVRDDLADQTDVLHYNLEIEIDPNSAWLGGSNEMTIRSRIDGLSTFHFRLRDNMALTSLTVDEAAVAWTRLDEATIEVTLDPPYNVDDVFSLYVAYNGHPANLGDWGSLVFSHHGSNAAPVAWSQSQPWWAYTWWPCKDENTDKATADLAFIVPDTMKVASNGLLQGVTDVGVGQKRYHWHTGYPTAPYLFSFATTNYDTFDSTWSYDGQTLPLQFYIYPEHNSASNREVWLATVDMLTVFSDLYGLYPFINEKYGMAEFGWSGGMEHQTMTSFGGFWEYLEAHELAHQWWGDALTCATWHDIWLNEGFATYSEALYYEFRSPGGSPELLHYYMASARHPVESIDSVYIYDISNMTRVFSDNIVYRKAAWVLHALRHVLGDDVFFDILAVYRARFEDGTVTTADFEQVCEEVSGRDLSWFFQEWVYKGPWPKYYWAWQPYTADGRYYVEVYVRQQPVAPFTMPIDIHTTSGGTSTIHPIWTDAYRENLLFEVDAPVDAAYFDPNNWFLRRGLTDTSFVEGPPKIVTLNPAPESVVQTGSRMPIEVGFHKDVVAGAQDFQLVGQRQGAIAFAFDYDGVRQVATLTPDAPLAPDWYTLTVQDGIRDVASGQALDGELTKVWFPEPLPSGNGQAGGDAVSWFVVVAPDAGDLNCDGQTNASDVNAFVLALLSGQAAYETTYPDCDYLRADLNGDGAVNFADINTFVAVVTR